jgi:hypothetical protein
VVGFVVDARDRWLAATPAQRAEAGPVAIATCGDALETLTGRLRELGYPVPAPIEPCRDLDVALGQFSEAAIVVPPALVEVWRRIGTLCLVDLDHYRHVAFWDRILDEWHADAAEGRGGPTPSCDGVVIDGPSQEGWVDYAVDMLEDLADQDLPPSLELGPDDLHKDNVSGSGPYELLLPKPGDDPWLAAVDGFRWSSPRPSSAPPDPPDLVSYLRTAILECGGFPGLYGHPAFVPVLDRLTTDLPVF